jgi:hypothetical protein
MQNATYGHELEYYYQRVEFQPVVELKQWEEIGSCIPTPDDIKSLLNPNSRYITIPIVGLPKMDRSYRTYDIYEYMYISQLRNPSKQYYMHMDRGRIGFFLGTFHVLDGSMLALTGILAPVGVFAGTAEVPGFGVPATVVTAITITPAFAVGGYYEMKMGAHHIKEFISGH